ncbi:MAG TPA: hypothetical protein VF790_14530 [Dissulfurispiraceae bacterium]
MRKFLTIAGVMVIVGAVLAGVTYFILMFDNPHMIVQPHIRAYERQMPLPPDGAVPVEPDNKLPPAAAQAAGMRSPLQDTPVNRARGKVYYDYYCVFCHDEDGRGNGPVGYSYMPKPADLHNPAIMRKSDGELLRGMLTGIGHEPVLARVVPVQHRWYIVLYMRALGAMAGQPTPAPLPRGELK